jgi:tryptophanyl-tRNA synthetase
MQIERRGHVGDDLQRLGRRRSRGRGNHGADHVSEHRRGRLGTARARPRHRDLAGSEVRGLLRQAKTDSDPHITYDPQDRPEVANLLLLTALCEETDPRQRAEQIGSRGAAELKRRATEAVNERLRPVRDRRSELMRDRGYLRTVLRDGSAAARSIAQSTLARVAAAMHTNY